MGKIISNALIILMMVLFPPAALMTVSQGAAEGDLTYPIKRGLEDSILFLVAFNPTTKAYFAVAQANRRYDETALLLSKGNNASSTLDELVAQSNSAAGDISKVSSSSRRALLIADLSNSITRYDQGLAQANEKISQDMRIRNSEGAPSPQPSPKASVSPSKPKASLPGSGISPAPSSVTLPIPQPSFKTSSPTPKPFWSAADEEARKKQEQIEKARKELEELRKRLEEEQKKLQQVSNMAPNSQQLPDNQKQDTVASSIPTPTPKPSPSPSQSPSPSIRANSAAGLQPSPSVVATNNPKDKANFNPKWNKTDNDPSNDNDNGDDD